MLELIVNLEITAGKNEQVDFLHTAALTIYRVEVEVVGLFPICFKITIFEYVKFGAIPWKIDIWFML